MDDIDRKLLMVIVTNPRISFRELSEKLGITKQAAHHRMQILKRAGVIERITVDISVPYLRAIPVAVFGISKASSFPRIFDELGQCEHTRRVIAGCGNYVYVNGILRNMSELDEFVGIVKRTAGLRRATVGLYSAERGLMPNYVIDGITDTKPSHRRLSPLDLRIIISLKQDVRKPVEGIAKELHVSAKTVRKHLEDMMSEGLVELHVRTDSPKAGDLMFAVHVTLREGADGAEVGRRLLARYPFKDAFLLAFSNIPKLLIWIFWTGGLSEMREILSATEDDEDIVALMPNLGYMMRIYSTWQDRLPEQMLQAYERFGTKIHCQGEYESVRRLGTLESLSGHETSAVRQSFV